MILHFVRALSRDSVQVVRSPDALKIVSNFPPTALFPEPDSTANQAQNALLVSPSSASAAFWSPALRVCWAAAAAVRAGPAAHLMVPVGEGMGLTRLRRSGSGMWIFSGEICG